MFLYRHHNLPIISMCLICKKWLILYDKEGLLLTKLFTEPEKKAFHGRYFPDNTFLYIQITAFFTTSTTFVGTSTNTLWNKNENWEKGLTDNHSYRYAYHQVIYFSIIYTIDRFLKREYFENKM